MSLATAAILLLSCAAIAEVSYEIDATLDLASSSLRGTVRITLLGADLPGEDVVFLSTYFGDGDRLVLGRATADGVDATVDESPGGVAITLPTAARGGRLVLEIEFSLAAVTDNEGIFFLDDNRRGGRWESWYPRLAERTSETSSYNVSFRLLGPGTIAHSAPTFNVEEAGSGRIYRLEDPAAASIVIAASPIFSVQRAEVGGCDLGIFVREGSERWGELLLSAAAEIYQFYAERIPGYARSRLDVVLAGGDYPEGEFQPRIVIVRDELDETAERFGGVFAASYLRWQASIEFARSYWAARVRQPRGAIPWLREGLTLLYAEAYADYGLLGGPAFENIRQFYINAAGKVNTSLSQSMAEAEAVGLDAMQVLARSKGLWVVGMLKRSLGRGGWDRFITALTDGGRDRTLGINEIESLAEEAAGGSLKQFFNDWVRGDARLDFGVDKMRDGSSGSKAHIVSRGDAAASVPVRAVFVGGEERTRTVDMAGGDSWVDFEKSGKLRRVEVDPERTLPDINRGDNIRSFVTAERIELLYSIDREFDIGELIFEGKTFREDGKRAREFVLSITNLSDRPRAIGLRLVSRFPGARNRSLSRLFIELAPGETKSVRDRIFFTDDGNGLAEVRAEYYPVANRSAFEKIDKRRKPALINYYIVDIGR